jgi:hypothetical protein
LLTALVSSLVEGVGLAVASTIGAALLVVPPLAVKAEASRGR